MPVYKTIKIEPGTSLAIWKVEETESFLSNGIELCQTCQDRYNGMKSAMHRKAFLSIRHLLALYGYTDFDLYYDGNGKPHLKDGHHISITHSYNFTGIIISENIEVGIDIERQRDKIIRIAHKFTPIEEYRTLANSDALIRKLTIVWGAKESLYKIYGEKGVSFLQHIHVDDFNFDTSSTTAQIYYQQDTTQYDIHFMEFEGFTCVYALQRS